MGKMICARCGAELTKSMVQFEYLGYEFGEDLPKCPKCGQVYLDESLVKGRMLDVETELEEK